MPVKIEPGAEPIPGYKLIERLGGGGFGEVWKAEAPGGLLKAMKFVYGELGNVSAMDDGEGGRADQEKKSLDRIKIVRHAYILSVERIDEIEDQLVITTELADRTSWDRFRECRNQGLPGIPREELLGFMEETAEALDFIFEEYQLQHLDIKPQNLFLVSRHIKVADFGLVKALENRGMATLTGGVTPVYAAPETFDGWLSRYSDQYSLAIVFQELLTGQRPFAGGTMRQLVLQHLQQEPDLSSLPNVDRPAVARALSKNPDERFPTCLDFVRALRVPGTMPARAAGFLRPEAAPAKPKETVPSPPVESGKVEKGEETCAARGKGKNWLSEEDTPPAGPAAPESPSERPPALAPQLDQQPLPEADILHADTPNSALAGSVHTAPLGRGIRGPSFPNKAVGAGFFQPALILGLGGLGVEALKQVRATLSEEVGSPEQLPLLRLLAIDTDPDALQKAGQGESPLTLQGTETFLARLKRAGDYLKPREGKLPGEGWLNPKALYRIPRHQNAAGARPLGRLAFIDHFRPLYRRLEAELALFADQKNVRAQLEQNDLGLRSQAPRVYLVACLAGNTGGGMFLDMAYLARHLLRKKGFGHGEVIGVFLVPTAGQPGLRSAELANTFAALKELAYYATGQAPFTARYDSLEAGQPAQSFRDAGPPLQRCYLVHLPEKGFGAEGGMQSALHLVAQFLYHELASPLGKAADEQRPGFLDPAQPLGQATFRTFGCSRFYWPRRRLLQLAAGGLCKRLTARWMEKKTSIPAAQLADLMQQRWDGLGLRPENLITRHQEECEKALGQAPEKLLQGVMGPLTSVITPKGKGEPALNVGPVFQALDALEKLVGIPEECRPQGSSPPEPGSIERALTEVSARLADASEQKLAEVVVGLIEEPAYRLAGAEEALRQLSAVVERALQTQEQLCKELQDRAVSLYQRIHTLLDKPAPDPQQTSSAWRIGGGRKTAPAQPGQGAEILELLKSYPKCRYQSLVLQQINRLYLSLRGHLSDQIREVGFCRQRLGELAQMFDAAGSERETSKASSAQEKVLLPARGGRLSEAVKRAQDDITAEDLLSFDKQTQEMIQKDFRALVQICMGPGHVLRTLAPALLRLGQKFLGSRTVGQSVTEMFLDQAGGDLDQCAEELKGAWENAAPPGGPSARKSEFGLVLFPRDPAGQKVDTLLRETVPSAHRVTATRNDEIVFFREVTNLPTSSVEQLGPVAQEAYRQRLALDPTSLHSREDIPDWFPQAPVS